MTRGELALRALRRPGWFLARVIDVLAYRWLRRRGYETVDVDALTLARSQVEDAFAYVDRSGHLNTVSGRRPRAIERLKGYLGMVYVMSAPDRPLLNTESLLERARQ